MIDGEPMDPEIHCSIHEAINDDTCECECEEGNEYPLMNAYGQLVDESGNPVQVPVYACQPGGDFCGTPGGCFWEGGGWRSPE
jgi:hypothetical protein